MKVQIIISTGSAPQIILQAETDEEKRIMKHLKEGKWEAFKRSSFTERQGKFMMEGGDDNAIALRPIVEPNGK